MGRKGEQQLLVGGEMVENRGQKSGFRRRRPQILHANAGEGQKTVKPHRIRGEIAKNLDGNGFGGGFREFGLFG